MRHRRAERVIADLAIVLAAFVAGWWRDSRLSSDAAFFLDLPEWAVLAVHAASSVVLLGRRRWPVTCAVVLASLAVLVPTYAALVVPYALLRYGPRPAVAAVWSVVPVLGWMVGADLWAEGDPISAPLLALVAGLAGAYARGRATALAHLAEEEQTAARAEERRRVAAELHDAVTHSVTLTVLQAGSLASRTTDPRVRSEAEGIRANGVRAMEELRTMVAILARPGSEGNGDPVGSRARVREVGDVVAEAAAAGQDVSFRQVGSDLPEPGLVPLLASATREALTNARRHAAGSSVAVRLIVRDDSVRLMIRNDRGRGEREDWPAGTGTGLRNLRPHITEHGGRLTTRRTPEDGFEVDVHLPVLGRTGVPTP